MRFERGDFLDRCRESANSETTWRSAVNSNSQFRFWNSQTTAGRYENYHRESSSGSFRNGTAGSNPFRSTIQSLDSWALRRLRRHRPTGLLVTPHEVLTMHSVGD